MVVAWFGVLGPLASRRPLSALAGVDGDGNNDGGNASPPGAGAGDDDDDGGGSLATSSVSVPAADALMPLYATVTVKFGAAAVGRSVEVAVEYRPRKGSSLASLWTAPETVLVDGLSASHSVDLFRVRAAQDYVYRVYARFDGDAEAAEVCGGFFTAQGTGWHRFDSGAYAAVTGDAPSFEVGAFAVYPSYTAHEQAKQWFQGLVAVDAEGWVVWMYSLCMLEAWDFLPDYSIALIARSDGSCSELTDHGKGTAAKTGLGADGRVFEANSQLQKIAPDGTLRTQFIQSCSGGPLDFNKLSHECRVDKQSANLQIFTTQYKPMVVPNISIPLKMGPTQTLVEHEDTFATTVVAAWDHEKNEVTTAYDLNDYVSPATGPFFETTAWNSVHMTCAGDAARNAIEFHHVSSISVGRDDNVLVSSRNLDTIWSLKRDGSGLQWTFSSHDEIGSDFAFERDLDKFYQPHAVVELDNGNIVMMDDGTDRPGCTVMRTGQCFSRAIMYRLDREAMVARVVWQFEAPDDVSGAFVSPQDMQAFSQRATWNEVGGSIYRLENGHYLVAFSSVEADDENPKGAASIFELDTDGNRTLTTKIDIPTPLSNVGMQNGYRFTPWTSISGENSRGDPFNTTRAAASSR